MKHWVGAFALCLSGCLAPEEGPINFRDDRVSLTSDAEFDPVNLRGRWYEVGVFAKEEAWLTGQIWVISNASPNGFELGIGHEECVSFECVVYCEDEPEVFKATMDGVASFNLKNRANDWEDVRQRRVLWTDKATRTFLVANLDHGNASLFSQSKNANGNALSRAKTVLVENGYDLSHLHSVSRWPAEAGGDLCSQ